jgi:peptidoglycan/LPS O-acetylase OafA/YrhL
MEHERFEILNGWRGVCALLVALHHLNVYSHIYDLPLIVNAWLFVDFFFVLSGFIISHAYMDRLGGWQDVRNFIVRRFGRLWPLHVAVLLPLVGLEIVKLVFAKAGGMPVDHPAFGTDNNSVGSIFTNLLLIHSLGVHDVLTWNRPSWSISVEFYTYIVFAAVFMMALKAVPRLVLPLAIAAAGGLAVFLFSTKTAMDTSWDYGFFRCLYGFFVGNLTYRIWRSGRARAFFDGRWPAELAALALVAIFVSLVGATEWSLAAPFVFAFVVLVFAHERGPVSRLMNVRPVALLGIWSYSIYMVHAPLVEFMDRGLKFSEKFTGVPTMIERSFPWEQNPVQLVFLGSRWAMDGLAVAYLLLAVGIAAATYAVVEQPCRRFFYGLTAPAAAKPAAAFGGTMSPSPAMAREGT